MILDERERRACSRFIDGRPVMLSVQCRAMVDQERLAPAYHEIGVAVSSVRIRDECIEPDNRRSKLGRYEIRCGICIEVERSIEIARSEVHSMARPQQILDFRVRLRAAESFRQLHERNLRRGKSHLPSQQSHDDLGDKRLHSLPRPAELDDEHAAVASIHDSG